MKVCAPPALGKRPAFRVAFKQRRCLVPVDSFYEWKRECTIRQPYRVVREDGRPLALAGLWAGWHDPATETAMFHRPDQVPLLNTPTIRLLTNNPAKVAGLENSGITVIERVPHHLPPNPHNERYLATKRDRTGHQL